MQNIQQNLQDLLTSHNMGGHGIDHMIAVMEHAKKAVTYEQLSESIKEQIILAALLHDADDTKIFPNSIGYQNARSLLSSYVEEVTHIKDPGSFIDDVIKLIDLVSCSKNGDSEPLYKWMAIPRDCDRLEAIGEIGIQRCDEYSTVVGAPDYVLETIKVNNEEELWMVATSERFKNYKKSISKIDHYYDKLLHIGKPECLKSQNTYILKEAARRNRVMIDYVLNFWLNH